LTKQAFALIDETWHIWRQPGAVRAARHPPGCSLMTREIVAQRRN